jgi:peptide/nickel transport system substrate-binding protein
MIYHTIIAVIITVFVFIAPVSAVRGAPYVETPSLQKLVNEGKLPSIEKRLPTTPKILSFRKGVRSPGQHGGKLNTLMARAKDVRLMVVYGYGRLMKYNRNFDLVPDILWRVSVHQGRVYTLYLRPGHKWSDGQPFTAEDFRYFWDDVANNPLLSPTGPPEELRVEGALPKFEIVDKHTVRFTWSKPNPGFLPALARARPPFIYRPAHYLKTFHAKYADKAVLNKMATSKGARNWAALHNKLDNPYKNNNIDMPSLQPWVNTTKGPSQRFVFERNPYFYKVDENGRQLPYIDQVVMHIVDNKIIPAQAGTGQADLQARYLRFDNYTFLKKNEKRAGFKVRLWRNAKGAHMALYPNLNVKDPVWRKLLRDVRFRRALSVAIHRRELNRVLYFGQAIEGQNTILPSSRLYKSDYRYAYAQFDLELANQLLDEIGLTKRNGQKIRLLPDGRPLEIIIETAGENTEESDVLELVHDNWRKIGVKLHIKPSHRDVVRNRIYAGETVMSLFPGLENGLPTATSSPAELAPTRQTQYQWPLWGQHRETNGTAGAAPDLPKVKKLLTLLKSWTTAPTLEDREEAWHQMLTIHADQVFTIGLVSGTLQPVVVTRRLKNVPVQGVYNWDPGAHFGIYEPDSFWFEPVTK